ncbi:hypothetical protein CDL15_Pgr027226 [Punica granatum]|uniref:Uncharacterized protein n=1 Tax=Punica granatum TaxID=22663 RepID=A0A218WBS1_PUNGR|nr:hypothetical protein CDL15_Pgr027226 [Punica granatum]
MSGLVNLSGFGGELISFLLFPFPLRRLNKPVGFLLKVIHIPGQPMLDLVYSLAKMAKDFEPEALKWSDVLDEA